MRFHTFAICAYKDSPYLESCIRSLKGQSLPSEIICCTSTPSGYIEKLTEKYHIPLYVREGESGIREDWNFAYRMADSRFVTIAHQDDMYGRRYVEELKRAYEKYPDMTVFTTDYAVVKNGRLRRRGQVELVKKLLRLPLRCTGLSHLKAVKKSALVLGNPICCPSCAYQKKLLSEPLFVSDFQFALDWDAMVSLAEREGRFVCVEKPLIYYRVHQGATTKECIVSRLRAREEEAMFGKFWPRGAVRLLMRYYRKAYGEYDL